MIPWNVLDLGDTQGKKWLHKSETDKAWLFAVIVTICLQNKFRFTLGRVPTLIYAQEVQRKRRKCSLALHSARSVSVYAHNHPLS